MKETKQQPSIAGSGHQLRCCLGSLHILRGILQPNSHWIKVGRFFRDVSNCFFGHVNRCVKKSLKKMGLASAFPFPSALQFSSQSEGSFRARQTGKLTLRARFTTEMSQLFDLMNHLTTFLSHLQVGAIYLGVIFSIKKTPESAHLQDINGRLDGLATKEAQTAPATPTDSTFSFRAKKQRSR